MEKDFDAWNRLKKRLDARTSFPFAASPEVWWCALGLNIGVEMNGKDEDFERPVVVIRAYSTEMLRVVPLTTRAKQTRFHLKLSEPFSGSFAVVSQARVISAKRLVRLIGKLADDDISRLHALMRELSC